MTAEKAGAIQRAVGIVVAGVGVGWAAGPGWGLAFAGVALLLDGLPRTTRGTVARGDRRPGGLDA